MKILLSDIPRDYDDWESRERFVSVAEHAYSTANYAYSNFDNYESKETSGLYFRLGYGFYKNGEQDKSLECYHKALAIREKTLGKEHIDTAMVYNNIANVYKSQGDYQTALEYLHNALEISIQTRGEENPFTTRIYNNIASVYSHLHDYHKALELFKKALLIRENTLGKEHPDTATAYNNIAGVYANQRDYSEALGWYQKALIIDEKVLGTAHPSIATTYNNIAFVYSNLGEYGKALGWYYKALEIRERVLGKEHPDTAMTYNNIAFVYSRQSDYNEALEWFYKALKIYEKILGKEHPDTAITYNNIALVYYNQGEHDKSLEWFYKALEINKKVLGEEHPYTIGVYNNIAEIENSESTNVRRLSISFSGISPQFVDLFVSASQNLPNPEISEFCEWYASLDSSIKIDTDLKFRMFLSDLQSSIKKIRDNSIFLIDDVPELCQYTKLSTLKILLKASTEDDKVPVCKFRLSNVAYLNDPSEGQFFIDLLNHWVENRIFDNLLGLPIEKENQHLAEVKLNDVYIGSFSKAKNKLPMWTLYGDNSNGCCMVFAKSFFVSSKSQDDVSTSKEFEQDIKLYNVHYYNKNTIDHVDDEIMRSLKAIATSVERWKKIVDLNPKLLRWIVVGLEEIRFLFKCDDYSYEDEVRLILRHDKFNKPFVDRSTDVPKLYINVNNPVALKEVILGAKVENPSAPAQFLLLAGVEKVTLSGITFR